MAQRLARASVERAAKKNDTVVIDFEGFVDGVAARAGKGENYDLKLGSGTFIPGFKGSPHWHKGWSGEGRCGDLSETKYMRRNWLVRKQPSSAPSRG